MHAQHATTLTDDKLTADPVARPDLRVVAGTRSARLSRAFALATAVLVAVGGYVHFCLYRHGYRTIPKIGVGFGLQVLTSAVVVGVLLLGPHTIARAARVAHLTNVTDRYAGTLIALAAAALAAGTLVAFALTRSPGGLFNFQERGLQPAPQALIALVAETGVLVVVGAWLVTDRVVQHRVRAMPVRAV